MDDRTAVLDPIDVEEEEEIDDNDLEVLDEGDDDGPFQLSLAVGGPKPTQSLIRLKANKETATAGGTEWKRGERVNFEGSGEIVEIRFTKKGQRIHVLEIDELEF